MIISFLGTRGSVPSPAPETVRYGGNTTCIKYVSEEGFFLLIDAGTGIRKMNIRENKKELAKNAPIYMLFTHSHWDHLQGLPFFFEIYNKQRNFYFLINKNQYSTVKKNIIKQMSDTSFPVDFKNLPCSIQFEEVDRKFEFSDTFKLELFNNHHPGMSSGVKFTDNNKIFTFITDNEIYYLKETGRYNELIDFCRGSDIIVHEAQYLEEEMGQRRGFGHSTLEEVTELFCLVQPKIGIFTHHDPDRKDDEIDRMEEMLKENIRKKNLSIEIHSAKENLTIKY